MQSSNKFLDGRDRNQSDFLESISTASWWQLFWLPTPYKHRITNDHVREYHLTFLEKVFVTIEFPRSCKLASYYAKMHFWVIILNVIIVIVSSIPSTRYSPDSCSSPVCYNDTSLCPDKMICRPEVRPVYSYINFGCAVFYLIDYLVRTSLCGLVPARLSRIFPDFWDDCEKEQAEREGREPKEEPTLSPAMQYIRYVISSRSIVDLLSIVPAFIIFLTKASDVSLSVFQMIRVLRLLSINVEARLMNNLLHRTLYRSREAFGVIICYLGLIILFFAAVMYAAESGTYTINDSYPEGAYLRPNGLGGEIESNFDSISTSIYYVIVTICTVGFGTLLLSRFPSPFTILNSLGDMVPFTVTGRAIACLIFILATITTAVPVSVLQSNFSLEYKLYVDKKKDSLRHRKTLQHRTRQLLQENMNDWTLTTSKVMNIFSKIGSSMSNASTPKAVDDSIIKSSKISFRSNSGNDEYLSKRSLKLENMLEEDEKNIFFGSIRRSNSEPKIQSLHLRAFSSQTSENAPHFAESKDSSSLKDSKDEGSKLPKCVHQILAMSLEDIEQLDIADIAYLFKTLQKASIEVQTKNRELEQSISEIDSTISKLFNDK